jgi:hypothetical protein
MDDIRQSILSLDSSLKILSTHYDSTKCNELKILSEQINDFEKRWTQLIDILEQCSAQVNKSILCSIKFLFCRSHLRLKNRI